jgi:hypothetical protein
VVSSSPGEVDGRQNGGLIAANVANEGSQQALQPQYVGLQACEMAERHLAEKSLPRCASMMPNEDDLVVGDQDGVVHAEGDVQQVDLIRCGLRGSAHGTKREDSNCQVHDIGWPTWVSSLDISPRGLRRLD